MTPKSTKYSRYYTFINPVLRSPLIKTYGYAIFTIIMSGVLLLFALKPTLTTIAVLQKKHSTQIETVKKIEEKTQNLLAARTNYQNIDPALKNKITTAIPTTSELANLVKTLEDSTRNTTASISALQFQPVILEKEGEGLKEILFTFNVEGSYESLKTILRNLYVSSRLFTVEDLSFNKISGGNSLLMSVSGKGYYFK